MATNIISSLGAGSGIDISSLVTQLTAVERAPQQQRIDARQKTLEAQISGYGQLKSSLATLQTAMGALGSQDLFNARSVNVPSSEAITADSVSPGAQTGTYKINVLAVASAQSLATKAQSQRDSALGKSGTMTISFGEWGYNASKQPINFTVNADRAAVSIDVKATDSLDSIADKINAGDSGAQASVLKVDGQYQLLLTSPSGEANAMQVTVDDASLNAFAFNATTFANVTETQQAQDAKLKVNGLTVVRESNSISDVIDGFAFTVNKVSTEMSFSVTADKSAAEEAVRGFVTAYNSFQDTTQKLVGYSRDEKNNLVRGDLAGDSSARAMVSRMRELIGGAVPGLESGFTALTNVGIRTERDGSLSINETEFSSAIKNQFGLVADLFAAKTTSANTAVKVNQGTFAANAIAGTYAVKITQDPTQGQALGTAITHTNFVTGTDLFSTPLTASGAGYSFKINVDGVNSNLIELTGTYNSASDLQKDLQSRINGDANLKAAGVALDVGFDTTTNSFSFTSRDYGAISQVTFTETGHARVTGSTVSHANFDPADETFTTPLNVETGNYSFKISIDGVESDSIALTGTAYATAGDLATAMTAQINADAKLKAANVALDVRYDAENDRFSFVSRTSGAASAVEFTETGTDMGGLGIATDLAMTGTLKAFGITPTHVRNPTQGQALGKAITHTNFVTGTDLFSTPLTASGAGYSFKINVDGANSNLIELTGTYDSAEKLRADLQSKINGDTSLKAAGVALDVGFDTNTNGFTFTSREYGSASRVAFTETGASLGALGLAPTQARIVGEAVSQAGFAPVTETFTTPLDAASGKYDFKINLNGVESDSIKLTGTYDSAEQLRADLQLKINGDAKLTAAGAALDVSYDAATNAFGFVSRTGGAASAVAFTEIGADMEKLGIYQYTGTKGVDVAGSINGTAGFGAGNVLLPDIDSDAYGLNLSVSSGAKAQSDASGTNGFQINFSRGFGGELSKLIDDFLGTSGIIKIREDGIQTQVDSLDEETTKLDRRMEGVSARMLAQFTAMERIVDSLQGTGSQMENLVNQLPFTASSN
jgi:flagellar hook-associated protein 2